MVVVDAFMSLQVLVNYSRSSKEAEEVSKEVSNMPFEEIYMNT